MSRHNSLVAGAMLWLFGGAALAGCAVSPNQVIAWQSADGTTPPRVIGAHPPPSDTDVVWHVGKADPQLLVATDWSARPAGWLRFDRAAGIGLQSPDGSRVQVDEALFASDSTLVARDMLPYIWADDNRHVCEVRAEDGGPLSIPEGAGAHTPPNAWLFLSLPGVSRRAIAQVGQRSPHGNVFPVACSVKSHRAVVISTFTVSINNVWVVDLSSTQVLNPETTNTDNVFDLVASPDAHLLAENSDTCVGADILAIAPNGAERRTGHVSGAWVTAFSADGAAVLTRGPLGPSSDSPIPSDIRRWSDGHVIWSGSTRVAALAVRPTGLSFLLGFPQPSEGGHFAQAGFIVDGGGATTAICEQLEIATTPGVDEADVGLPSSAVC